MDKPPFSRQKIDSWSFNTMKPVKNVKGWFTGMYYSDLRQIVRMRTLQQPLKRY